MTLKLAKSRIVPHAAPDQHLTLYGIPYNGYVAFLDAVGEIPLRVNYDDGVMEIMTISAEHDGAKRRIGGMVEDLAIELGIEVAPRGSTTFRSKQLKRGLEPDESYYIENEARIRAKKQIDLRRDPPPDLVIEIDVSPHDVDREDIYAAMGVPELWKYDGKRISFWQLDGMQWRALSRSLAFPRVRSDDLERFFKMVPRKGEMAMRRAFRTWIRETLLKQK